MRLVNTHSVKPGVVIAKPIYNEQNLPLVQKGTVLTEKMIHRLINKNITYVYIEDERTEDVESEDFIDPQARIQTINVVKETFMELKEEGFVSNSYILTNRRKQLLSVLDHILNEINSKKEAISLLSTILTTDDYTFEHSVNVAIYSLAIGTKFNLSKKELIELGMGALFHDIGKVFIDKNILQKTSALTEDEFNTMKTHTTLGYDYLRKQHSMSSLIAHCAYQHHERLNGTGYPRGLIRNEIHPYGKIIAIADVYDAVTSNRIYRKAMLPHEGLEILYGGAIGEFEKSYVEAFKKSVVAYPNGLTVELSDKRTGVVIRQNKQICDRPIIRIIKEHGETVHRPYEVDLSKNLQVMIQSCHAE